MGQIPQSHIDDLVQRVDIVELVNARVRLKKRGKEWVACCPFHQEKSPSFTVNAQKQFFHCFGCGEHGTAIGFLMRYDRMSFIEAVQELSEQLGLPVPNQGPVDTRKIERQQALWTLNAKACQHYQNNLKRDEKAINYLKARGLDGRTAAQFKLGYAPDDWHFLTQQCPNQKTQLLEAGLTAAGKKGDYDRFRGRIMFPIQDLKERVIGFGGRLIEPGEPKYLNSPETPLFHKSRALYNVHRARASQADVVLVVEGYMDVIALAQQGLPNVVATMGTAASAQHIEQLWRYFETIVFCFDGDEAGERAAWRALDNALPKLRASREARFLMLPSGQDPDSIIRRDGADAFKSRVDAASNLSTFFIQTLSQKYGTHVEGRSKLIEAARPLLQKIQDNVFRELLTDALAKQAQTAPETVTPNATAAPLATPQASRLRGGKVRQALHILVQHPTAISAIEDLQALKAHASLPGMTLLLALCQSLIDAPVEHTAQLLERFRDHEDHVHLETLASQISLTTPEHASTELQLLAQDITRSQAHRQRLNDLLQQEQAGTLNANDKEALRELLRG